MYVKEINNYVMKNTTINIKLLKPTYRKISNKPIYGNICFIFIVAIIN